DSSPPVPDLVSVAVNVPRALAMSPLGVGVSFAATIAASIRIVFAWLLAAAPPTAARANASATAPASKWNLRTIRFSSHSGIVLRPTIRQSYERVGPSDLPACAGWVAG